MNQCALQLNLQLKIKMLYLQPTFDVSCQETSKKRLSTRLDMNDLKAIRKLFTGRPHIRAGLMGLLYFSVLVLVSCPAVSAQPSRTQFAAGRHGSAADSILRAGTGAAVGIKRDAEFSVNFRWDDSVIRPGYMGTRESLEALADSIARIGLDDVDSLSVVSYSSPEGPASYNARLSERRRAAMALYLSSHYPGLLDRLRSEADGESWQLFRARTLSDSTLTDAQRTRLLEIIDSPLPADKKKTLIKTWSPALWRKVVRQWFVDMRRSFIRLSWTEFRFGEGEMLLPGAAPACLLEAPSGRIVPTTYDLWERRTILALKTNLLYDAVTALNFEVEVPLGDDFSLAVEDVFPWWNWGPNGNKYCFQIWEMGVEPRWWFARTDACDRLSGHFLGVYGMSGKYDLQWDRTFCWQGEFWSAGLTYGYAMPLGSWCNLELSASLGFLRSDWRHYEPGGEYEHLYRDPFRTGVFTYLGPTKLKASLVVPITIRRRVGR